jgi:outer membrane protein assembly factor BamB
MKAFLAGIVLPGLMAVGGVGALVLWLGIGPANDLHARLPGLDRPPGAKAGGSGAAALRGQLTTGEGKPSSIPGEWPCFRGKNLDGMGHEPLRLARQWPASGPPALWSIELGEGHAGAAVWGGRVYVLDYDRKASADALRCLSLDDGKQIWCYQYPVDVKRNHGMSRTVPAVNGKYVVSLGPKCHVTCLDAVSGKRIWMLDLVRQFGASVPQWYAGQCPIIEGNRAILAPGGSALLIAVDCQTGQVIWKSPNPRAWNMTHTSISPMELAGRRMYVYCGKGGVAGVSADDGSILWDTTDWKISIATCPSPVILPEGKIFFCGGYNSGALLLQVSESGGQFTAKTLLRLKPDQFGSTQHTPILDQGHLFGVREKDKQLVCLDLRGRQVWTSGSKQRFGLGPYLIADGLIYVMDDAGTLTLAEAATSGYEPLAQAHVLPGHDSWGPMALVAGRLLVRDLTRMTCLDVADHSTSPPQSPATAKPLAPAELAPAAKPSPPTKDKEESSPGPFDEDSEK